MHILYLHLLTLTLVCILQSTLLLPIVGRCGVGVIMEYGVFRMISTILTPHYGHSIITSNALGQPWIMGHHHVCFSLINQIRLMRFQIYTCDSLEHRQRPLDHPRTYITTVRPWCSQLLWVCVTGPAIKVSRSARACVHTLLPRMQIDDQERVLCRCGQLKAADPRTLLCPAHLIIPTSDQAQVPEMSEAEGRRTDCGGGVNGPKRASTFTPSLAGLTFDVSLNQRLADNRSVLAQRISQVPTRD